MDLGGFQCDIPLLGVPYAASVGVTFGVGATFNISMSGEQTCDETDICFQGNVNVAVNGGASATAAAGVIRVSLTVDASAQAYLEYCTESGWDAGVCVNSVYLVGTAKLAFTSRKVKFLMWKGNC